MNYVVSDQSAFNILEHNDKQPCLCYVPRGRRRNIQHTVVLEYSVATTLVDYRLENKIRHSSQVLVQVSCLYYVEPVHSTPTSRISRHMK
jgi:hypothetical protein